MVKFSSFLGIDQTGAASHQGRKAKPLKVCLAQKVGVKWHVFTQDSHRGPLLLDSLTPKSLEKLFAQFSLPWPHPGLGILADCVLGMPKAVFPYSPDLTPAENLWSLFQGTATHSYEGALFGLPVSENFFLNFLKKKNEIPIRQCEKISGSNSLFTTRPFQKNIQTGSYRLWKDLGSDKGSPWLNVWPFNTKEQFNPQNAWLFEGYPSLYWNTIFQIQHREPKTLVSKLKNPAFLTAFKFDTFSHLKIDHDLCDAVVLALAGIILQEQKKLFHPFPGFWDLPSLRTEGWIAGLNRN